MDWTYAWQPLVERVGDLLDDGPRWGPDRVEAGTVRRYLEPLELDCALHTDPEVARVHGYPDLVAPYTAVWSHVPPPAWQPGQPLYDDASRDAQPLGSSIADDVFPGAPPTSGMVGTGITMEFDRPLVVGERAAAGPRRLLACVPKETRLGRGAFVTFEREVIVESGERVCRITSELFLFDPADPAGARDEDRHG